MVKGLSGLCFVLVAWLFASPVFAENPAETNLDGWVGAWQMTSGNYEENWLLLWNEERTHLNLTFDSFKDGAPAFKATGFVFFDPNTSRLHFYMMMNNGALHENIGRQKEDGTYRLQSKTYGGPIFPDHDMIVSFEDGKMIFEYIYKSDEGEPEIFRNVFRRVDDP